MFVLLVKWQSDTEWPAVTGPFDTEADAQSEVTQLIESGEVSPDTHDWTVIEAYEPF